MPDGKSRNAATSDTLNILPESDSFTVDSDILPVVINRISITMPVAIITGRKNSALKKVLPRNF